MTQCINNTDWNSNSHRKQLNNYTGALEELSTRLHVWHTFVQVEILHTRCSQSSRPLLDGSIVQIPMIKCKIP